MERQVAQRAKREGLLIPIAFPITMRLKLKMLAQGLWLEGYPPVQFTIDRRSIITVILSSPSAQELEKGLNERNGVCSAIIDVSSSIKKDIKAIFEDLANNRIPAGSQPIPENEKAFPGTTFHPSYRIPLLILPGKFQDYVTQQKMELNKAIVQCVNTLRWWLKAIPRKDRFSIRHFRFDLGDSEWRPIPSTMVVWIQKIGPVEVTEEIRQHIEYLVNNDQPEPFAHELLREAMIIQRHHPRSSLVMAVTAAETAIKQLIAKFVPDAAWLIQELPSPPVVRLIKEYLTQFSITVEEEKQKIDYPDDEVSILKKAVQMRNRIVHGRKTSITNETLREIFRAISNIFYRTDYYSGHQWSLEHILNIDSKT